MQTISVSTTQNVSIHYPLASIGDRIFAHFADRFILTIYTFFIIVVFISLQMTVVWIWIVMLLLPWLFFSYLFEIFMNGQTPGKRMLRIQVVRMDGTQATIGDYTLRAMFSIIDFYLLSGAIAILCIAVGGKGQRLGDIVAGTTVVKLIPEKEVEATQVFIAPDETYQAVFPQAIQLTQKDIEIIQRALEARRNFGSEEPVVLLAQKLKTLLGIQTDLPPGEFLYTIVKDFNHLSSN